MNPHKKSSIILMLFLLHFIFFSKIILILILKFFPILLFPENLPFYQIIGSITFFIIPFIIYMFFKKLPLNKILPLSPLSFKNIIIIIFLSLAMQPLLQFINFLTMIFFENKVAGTISSLLSAPYWKLLLAVAIVPALLEELIFRGLFIKEYEKCSFWYSIFFSGLFFGIMHLTLTQLFYATVAGIIMAYLVKVTNSIWASVLCHFILNGTQITLAFTTNKILEKYTHYASDNKIINISNNITNSPLIETILPLLSIGMYTIITLPFFVLCIYIFKRINKDRILKIKEEDLAKKQNNPKVFNIYFIVCIIIYILYILFEYIISKIS